MNILSDMTIRKAKIEDLPKLQQLSAELFLSHKNWDSDLLMTWSKNEDGKKYLLGAIRGRKSICYVCILHGEIVGYLTGKINAIQTWRPLKRAELENLYIQEKHRNSQLGTRLVEAFIAWSKEKGMDRVFVCVSAENEHALRFYKRNLLLPYDIVLERSLREI